MVREIEATVERSQGWWAVSLPIKGIIRHTQGRTLKEAELMARDLLEIYADEYGLPELATAPVSLHIAGEEGKAAVVVERAKAEAECAAERAREAQRAAVCDLRRGGLTMADIGRILGLTKGRISQLVNA